MAIDATRQRGKRRLRILLGVLVISLVVGGTCGVIRLQEVAYNTAVAALEKMGGSVAYDGQSKDGTLPGPAWIRGILGDHCFTRVVGAHAKTDDGLELIARRWPQIKELELSDAGVTDDGLNHLDGLSKLRSLSLEHTSITDAGVAQLKGRINLYRLDLGFTQITNAALATVKDLTRLRYLGLRNTRITDAGLRHVQKLTELQDLDLQGTDVSNAGLKHLKGLNQLRQLNLPYTRVDSSGVEDLENALPKCHIFFWEEGT